MTLTAKKVDYMFEEKLNSFFSLPMQIPGENRTIYFEEQTEDGRAILEIFRTHFLFANCSNTSNFFN